MPDVKIYEDRYYQDAAHLISEINTPEQVKRGQFYRNEYWILYGEMQKRLDEWSALEKHYQCERDIIDVHAPNSYIPIINPIINGQIASMIEKNLQSNVIPKGPADDKFAHTVLMLCELLLNENKIKQVLKELCKNYLLFGSSVLAVSWDSDRFRGSTGAIVGFPEFRVPEITRIIIDGRTKNMSNLQDAEYIIEEIGFKSINYVRLRWGDEVADSLMKINHVYPFDGETSYDDLNSTSLLYIWTRNNKAGNLQRIVMDKRGFIIEESDESEPFYKHVNNQYPYFFAGMYKKEGTFHRFGDGKVLLYLQETVNKVFDELVTACKFNSQPRTFVDPKARIRPADYDNDPSHIIAAVDPRANIYTATPPGVSPIVERLINTIMNEAEKASRFSALMNGNTPSERMTATQAGIQVQQGSATINDKRMDISQVIQDAVKYSIGMMMEFWTAAQAIRVVEDENKFEWVDPRQLTKIPVLIPSDEKFRKKWAEKRGNKNVSAAPLYMSKEDESNKWMQLEVDGEPATKVIDYDLEISIGEGLPNNKVALYNIILSLAQLQLIDEATGQPMPLLGREQFKKMAEDLLGLPLESAQQNNPMMMQQNPTGGMSPSVAPQKSLNINPNIPGATLAGQQIGGGVGG